MPVVEGRPSSSPSSSQPSLWRSPSSLPSSLLRPLVPAFFLIVVPARLCLVGSCQVDLTLSGLLCASSVIRNDGRGEALLLMHMMLLRLVVRRQDDDNWKVRRSAIRTLTAIVEATKHDPSKLWLVEYA